MNQIKIDLNKIKNIATRGVHRAAIFMGLGVNAARDKSLSAYQLPNDSLLRIIPDNVDEKSITHFKESFEDWIITCGLRELIETFAIFLDKIHYSCLVVAVNKGQFNKKDAESFQRDIERKGVEEKLIKISNRFGVTTDMEKHFKSINQARNCITHRHSIVGYEDIKGNKSLKINWWAMEIIAETLSGKKTTLKAPFPKEGIVFEEDSKILLKVTDRTKEIKPGMAVILSPADLTEICLMVIFATEEIIRSTFKYFKSLGLEVTKTEQQHLQGPGDKTPHGL